MKPILVGYWASVAYRGTAQLYIEMVMSALPDEPFPQFEIRNPVTGDIASRARAMGVDDALAVVADAKAAFPAWAAIGPTARRAIFLRAADAVDADAETLTKLMMAETGAAAPWCRFNVRLSANMLREAGSLVTQISGEVIPSDKPGRG